MVKIKEVGVFTELSIIILLATGVSLLMRFLKQPLIVGHILTGLLAGPFLLDLIRSPQTLEVLSKLGITALLFIVGLSLSPLVIREVGKVSLITGLGQIIFTSLFGYLILKGLGFGSLTSVYLAIALTFSSTIIILKLLSDKGDVGKLYGKISTGFLLVQDVVASVILVLIPILGGTAGSEALTTISSTFAKGVLAILGLFALSKFFLPKFTRFVAQSQELLFLFSIAWGMGLAAAFSLLGFSLEIGALIAGVSLSATPYAQEISSRMRPIRDLFIVLFFILLGSQLAIGSIANLIVPALVLSLFVIVGNPLIVFILMNLLGHTKRNGFYAGLTVAQISEFSLILVALGAQVGHLSEAAVSLTTLVGLLTIALSTYLILYEENIYSKIKPVLSFLEVRKHPVTGTESGVSFDTILFGYHRVGQDFVQAFKGAGREFVVVDFNPESVQLLEKEGINHIYGDAGDAEFLDDLDLANTRLVVSTIPDHDTNLLLVEKVKEENPNCVVIVISHNVQEAEELYQEGATYVMMPHYIGAQTTADMISKFNTDLQKYEKEREKHLKYLKRRQV